MRVIFTHNFSNAFFMSIQRISISLYSKREKMAKQYDVFISYRRQRGSGQAALVRDELLHRGIKASRIFMDIASLSTGNYLESISSAIAASRNLVVVITDGCFDGLTDDSNWVREIRNGLSCGINIVPIYFDDIKKIDRHSLPSSIRALSFENAVLYIHEYSDASFSRLADRLEKEPHAMPRWAKWAAAAVASSGLAFGAYSAVGNAGGLKEGEVYVIESTSSKCYHMDKRCVTLKNATHKLKKVTEEEAEAMGKRPCKKCCR